MKKIVGRLTGLALIAGLLLFLVGCQSTYVRSAKIYMQDNDPENAKEVLLEGVKMTPEDPELFYILGKVYAELEEWQEMSDAFDRTQELTNEYDKDITSTRYEAWRTVFNSSVDPFNEGKYDEALEIFQTALIIRPGDAETLKRIGLCYLKLENNEKAEEYLLRALTKDEEKEDLNTRINLILIFLQEERWEDIVRMSDETLMINETLGSPEEGGKGLNQKRLISVISNKAIALQKLDRNDEAIATWDEALKTDPKNPDFFYNKALLLHSMERWEEASAAYLKVLELNPNDDEARKNVARALLAAQKWDTIVQVMEPWLFPDGVKDYEDPVVKDKNAWLILNAAYQNLGRMDDSTVIAKILNKLE